MPSFALIACDHGFGHVRRMMFAAAALLARGARVSLFAPATSATRFECPAGLDLVPFETLTNRQSLRNGDARLWAARLPPLDGFDVVVSDNLPEVLDVRPDTILSGSFFWHSVLDDIDPTLAARARSLIEARRPRMIASKIFAMPELETTTALSLVGLFATSPRPRDCGDDLLIACGGTAGVEGETRRLLADLVRAPHPPFPTVWVEPRLMPAEHPEWMRAATFKPDMYKRLRAAICRAGVGTMTDCAWARARVFAIGESGNAELSFNATRFSEFGIGEIAADAPTALEMAESFAASADARQSHAEAVARLDFDGAAQMADLLMAEALR